MIHLFLLILLLAPLTAQAATISGGGSGSGISSGTTFPSSPAPNQVFIVTDDSAVGACDSNAGASVSLCWWDGDSWEPVGDGTLGSGLASTDIDTCAELAAIMASETGTCGSLVFSVSPTLTTPNLGTPSAVTLTNGTGLPVGGLTGLGTGVGTWLGTPSSSNLASAVTGETGSGALVFGTAPTIDAGVFTTSVLLPNGTSRPGTCSIGMIYFDNDESAGVNLYGCTASNTWTLLGDGGGGSGDVTAAAAFATDNVLIKSDGTGKGVQATGISVADTTNIISGSDAITFGSNPGDAGRIRLSNGSGEGLCWEIATPGTDKCLILNASDQLDFNGTINLSGSTTGSVQVNGATSGSLAITTADATAQAITVTGAAQTTGGTTLTIPDMAGVNDTFLFAAKAATLTNKTFDAAGTGNSLTIKQEFLWDVAGCVNTTAGSVFNLPVSNPAVATCDTGSNIQSAYMAFNADTDQGIEGRFRLRTGFTGTIDWTFKYKMASATSGAIGWCVQMVRVLPGTTAEDPAYPAQASGNCVSDTVPGTAGLEDEVTISGATCTSCAAGDTIYFRVSRDANGGAVTDSATGNGELLMTGPSYAVVY